MSRKNQVSGNRTSKGFDPVSALLAWRKRLKEDPEEREQARKIAAWTLLFTAVLTLLACISYFFTGNPDQSVVENEGAAPETRNWMGFLGAWIANQIIHRGFGVLGLMLPVYGIVAALILLEDDYYHYLRRFLKYVLFITLWGSVFLSYIVLLAYSDGAPAAKYDLGGGFGAYINLLLFGYVGRIGVAFLLLFVCVIFLVINYNAEVRASRLLQKVGTLSTTVKQQAAQIAKIKTSGTPAPKTRKEKETPAPLQNKPQEKPVIEPEQKEPLVPSTELSLPPAGEQIRLKVEPPVIRKAPALDGKKGGLTFEIVDSTQEESPDFLPELPKLEQLGEDNVGKVVGGAEVMKIIDARDMETDATDEVVDWEKFDPTKELSDYEPPVLELLEDHGAGKNRVVDRDELEGNKNKIVETLANYGIEITNIKATIGPTVTLYEIVPAAGVRISKIRSLEDDIALSLAALGIRIIAPIPGKGTIGIEVPNSNREVVSLRGILSTVKFQTTSAELPIAIGRTISNEVYIADLAKMPHLLIAGSTGQGKSVGLNTIITSLLYKKHPAEIKFVLIDPKKVEMTLYQVLSNHFLAQLPDQDDPIITDVKVAVRVLKSLCVEMDERYELLKKARVRNLKEYNDKFTNRKLNPRNGHKYLPFIILVIDELADMMMVAGKEVEMPIARLAQLSRAVGIHLVVATQRPSVNVITGIIKANFPARMSYRVISKVDSRTILDANGADQLIGRGDLLLSTGSDLIRIQNAFIDTPEVERLVDFIAKQRGFLEPYILPDLPSEEEGPDEDGEPFERDSQFEEAARVIVRFQIGSASLIQRKLKLGYNRAGRIIDQLEKANIVGPYSGSKARDVLVSDEAELERYLNSLS